MIEEFTCRRSLDSSNIAMVDPHLPHVLCHSPDGFEWGYHGSGPSDLALSLITYWFCKEMARKHYHSYKAAFIAKLPHEGGILKREDAEKFLGLV